MSARFPTHDGTAGPTYRQLVEDCVDVVEWVTPDGRKHRAPTSGGRVYGDAVVLESSEGERYGLFLFERPPQAWPLEYDTAEGRAAKAGHAFTADELAVSGDVVTVRSSPELKAAIAKSGEVFGKLENFDPTKAPIEYDGTMHPINHAHASMDEKGRITLHPDAKPWKAAHPAPWRWNENGTVLLDASGNWILSVRDIYDDARALIASAPRMEDLLRRLGGAWRAAGVDECRFCGRDVENCAAGGNCEGPDVRALLAELDAAKEPGHG